MAKGAFIFNLMARRYARTPIADQASYEHKLELTRKYFTPESEVLEIGCGTGSTAILHAPFVKHILATDYAHKMIEIANEKKAAGNIQNVDFDVAVIEDTNIEPAKYDVVLALNIIHLLEDKPTELNKIFASVKPGGYFISSTPCFDKIPGIWRLLLVLFRLVGFPKMESMSADNLKQLMRDAGFTIEEEWAAENNPKVPFIVASRPAV
ncbi:MAG: class I SAM-dependent methyltransferase [Gammaproteobacteria bacterium]